MTVKDTEIWLAPDRLFEDGYLVTARCICIKNGVVDRIDNVAEVSPDARIVKVPGTISPGFVDLQVNGGGGILINEHPDATSMLAVAEAHRKLGTAGILATVITDERGVIEKAADSVIQALGQGGVLGIHIEGPHISAQRRGTHKETFVRPVDATTFETVEKLRAANVPTKITVAPEMASNEDIARLSSMGAIVSLGHSAADRDVANAAFAAGATCVTHLFNAMSPMENRAPGLTGAAINSQAYAGIICDGIHVDDDMIALAIRARPVADRMFLVSDAMPTVGGPPMFDLYGKTLHLEGERLINDEGSLAGAHTTMAKGVERLVGTIGVSPQVALRMAITVPSALMGLDRGHLISRPARELVLLDPSYALVDTLDTIVASQSDNG